MYIPVGFKLNIGRVAFAFDTPFAHFQDDNIDFPFIELTYHDCEDDYNMNIALAGFVLKIGFITKIGMDKLKMLRERGIL